MKTTPVLGALIVLTSSLVRAEAPAEILIPGQNLFTESVTSTADGAVIVGALGSGAIFRAKPGAQTADLWIKPGTGGLANPLGVFADDKANILWTCSTTLDVPKGSQPPRSTLHAFDLTSGAPKGKYLLPTAAAMCNDIAVGSDGTAYATDYQNMQIVALAPGAKALEVWAGDGAFGGKDDGLDGIAIVQGHVIVNAISSNKLFSVPIGADGKAGTVMEVELDRPLKYPDGQRTFGKDGILVVDSEEGGRLVSIALSGEHLGTGKVTTLQTGFAEGPASVAVVGDTAYVIEAQFDAMDKKTPTKPFKAKAVKLGALPTTRLDR